MNKGITYEKIVAIVKKNSKLSAKDVADILSCSEWTIYNKLCQNKVSFKDLKKLLSNSSPQKKAWKARRKKEFLKKYDASTNAHEKMVLSKRWKKMYGTELREAEEKIKKVFKYEERPHNPNPIPYWAQCLIKSMEEIKNSIEKLQHLNKKIK